KIALPGAACDIARSFQPHFIFSDVDLSPTETGIALIRKLKSERIIDYRTQCCYYTYKNLAKLLLPDTNNEFILLGKPKAEPLKTVFLAMRAKYSKCSIKKGL